MSNPTADYEICRRVAMEEMELDLDNRERPFRNPALRATLLAVAAAAREQGRAEGVAERGKETEAFVAYPDKE